MNRYRKDRAIRGGLLLASNSAIMKIRQAIKHGEIKTRRYTLKENERLDILAGKWYGDSRLWWILAAASNIGWGLQIPPGTRILIPLNLDRIKAML